MEKIVYIKTKHFDAKTIGGSIAHTTGIINGFFDTDADVEVLTDIEIGDIRAKQHVLPTGRMHGNLLYDLISARKFYHQVVSYLKGHRVSFIYHRHVLMCDVGVKLKRKYGIPLVIEFNSSENDKWKINQIRPGSERKLRDLGLKIFAWAARAYTKRWEPWLLKQADMLVVVSQPLKEKLMEMGVAGDKILVLPNGVDPDVFVHNEEVRRKIREMYGLSSKKVVVGFAGTFGTWHGIPELTEAILNLKDLQDVGYLLIGDGYHKKEMQQKLAGIDGAVFPDSVPHSEMPAHLSACDILVVANSWNSEAGGKFFGSPTKLFEYMSMGKAIVASDLEQIGQLLEDGRTALLFKAGDAGELTKTLVKAVNSPELRRQIGGNARNKAIREHTWVGISKEIINKFNKLYNR